MLELYAHQTLALEKMHDGCILTGGVGSGKSITSLAYYQKNHFPKSLYIITTARKRDELEWDKELAQIGLKTGLNGHSDGLTVVVDSWNNLHKFEAVREAFFIFDEQRLVGYGAWTKSFLKIAKANKWVLLSATPGDRWHDYVPVFIANGYFRNKTEFEQLHVVWSRHAKYPKVDRYTGEGSLLKYRNQVLVPMPFKRHTTRNVVDVKVKYSPELYNDIWKRRWNIFEECPVKEVGELFFLARKVTYMHPSRLYAVRDILEKHKRVIVFYNFDFELEMLRGFATEHVVAEWNGKRHQPVPIGDEWLYLVQYAGGAEAWNCVATNAIVFFSLNYSYRIMEQAMGRIDRLNTGYYDLYYYRLVSDAPIDKAVSKALGVKKEFNEKDFMAGSESG